MLSISLRFLSAVMLSAGLCSAGAVWAQASNTASNTATGVATGTSTDASADTASGDASFERLKVLQSIESGLWQVSTRMEPAPKSGAMQPPPDQGCLSSQSVAEDLRAFLSPEDGMSCKGVLQTNTDELAVLQVICPLPQPVKKKVSVEESLLRSAPSTIEVRRFSNTHFQVSSKSGPSKVSAKKPAASVTAVQDYERLDDCPW